jgi:hypothetical protein
MVWLGHVACMEEIRNVYRTGKPEVKRQLGRPSSMWEDSIKMDVKWGVRVWTVFTWLGIESSRQYLCLIPEFCRPMVTLYNVYCRILL